MTEALKLSLINLAYLVAAVFFILGLKGMTHPRTAVRGNMIGALGMLLAVVVTLFDQHILDYKVIMAGIVVGSAIGAILAVKIEMTAMPQMVAVFNGFGGIASSLIAGAALVLPGLSGEGSQLQSSISTAAAGIVGAVTFTGSMIAFFKLQGIVVPDQPVLFPGQKALNAIIALVAVGLGVYLVMNITNVPVFWIMCGVAAVLGVLLVIGIGGADMPVVVSLLNSYSGIAAAMAGFVLNNNGLIIAGSLVGASGLILTNIMCKAMNRSLANVLFGGVGAVPSGGGPKQDDIYAGKIKATSAEEIAMMLDNVSYVVIVPGYGMAVAQAQHAVRDLSNLLESKGAKVEFGIHPVAGRMPGHMNVLLAESDVSYDKLKEMDEINTTIEQADMAIVLGANDVVNPTARTDPNSPIAGMPIIDVDKARTVVMIKRSLSPRFCRYPEPALCRRQYGDVFLGW